MKNSKLLSIVLLWITAAVYIMILFAVKSEFQLYSWVAYGFTMVGFASVTLCLFLHKKYPMYAAPMMACAMGYCVLQFLYGGVFVMCFNNLSTTFVVVSEIVLFAVYLFLNFALLMFREGARSQDEEQAEKVAKMRRLKVELNSIAAAVPEEALRGRIQRLADKAGASDPMSDARLKELEERIQSNVNMLREDVEERELNRVADRMDKLERMLDERNALCATMK